MRLKIYNKKRDFKKTPEPKIKKITRHSSKKLFVVQKHDASHLHYDFRLELAGVLVSWAIPKGPCLDPAVKRLAVHVEDHPLEYGSFEGIIPENQYGGGTVMIWDRGEWESLNPPEHAYRKGDMSFILKGDKLKGKWKLIRINKNDKTWLLIKVKDEYTQSIKKYDIESAEPESVESGLSLTEIAKQPLLKKTKKYSSRLISKLTREMKPGKIPKSILPELATLVDNPPTGKNWLHEIKLDGYRIIAIKNKGKTRLFTRNRLNWTNKFKTVANSIDQLPINTVIFDGEIVVLDKNQKSNFQLLQNAIKNKDEDFIYYIFDLLYLDKFDLTSLPIIRRKKILETLIPSDQSVIRFNDHIIGHGKKLLKKICQLRLEGVISKDIHSLYRQKRTPDWMKVKCLKRQEFLIVGFTPPKNKRSYFGALLLATYNKHKELVYSGHVGTGFTEISLETIYQALSKYITHKMPFKKVPPDSRHVTWIKPVLIAEVEFTEWTQKGLLRNPSFKGLRGDKSSTSIIREIPIKFTNPNKILYPEDKITKRDLIEYYQTIEDWILPYILERPLTLLRCPNGYEHCFYQRHESLQKKQKKSSALKNVLIKEKEGKAPYVYIDNHQGLLLLPQMGVLEIHPWGSPITDVTLPDVIIFDLDPAPDVKWKTVVNAAFDIKKHLTALKLHCFVKTTGGKGLHIVIPIKQEYGWKEVKLFAKTFVDFLVMNNPDLYTNTMQKIHRKGRIFIDYLRNQPASTAIAPYSTRARIHAPIATPIHWDELTHYKKDTFFTLKTILNRLNRLKHDPWIDYFKLKQSLNMDKF